MPRNITGITEFDQHWVIRQCFTAVTTGQTVKYHTDQLQVVPLGTSDALSLGCGVALLGAAAGQNARIMKQGVVPTLLDGTADIAIGDYLQSEGTNAGVLKVIALRVDTVTNNSADRDLTGAQVVPLVVQAADVATGTLTNCMVNFP